MTTIRPELFAELPSPPTGWFDVGYCVTIDGALGILRSNVDLPGEWHRSHISGKATPVTERKFGRLSAFDGRVETDLVEFELEQRFPTFDRLPDRSWIVADARCKPGAPNAVIISDAEEVTRRFPVGDGIEHLQCDLQGNIWVGYFDEGVFGNDGWILPGRRWPITASGLVKFGPAGEVLWQLPASSMADCYALNVGKRKVWTYYYTDFPITEIDPESGMLVERETDLSGGSCLACSARHALLAGGYGEDRNRLVLLELGVRARVLAQAEYACEEPAPGTASLLAGRDQFVHVVSNRRWYKLALYDAMRQMTRG